MSVIIIPYIFNHILINEIFEEVSSINLFAAGEGLIEQHLEALAILLEREIQQITYLKIVSRRAHS